MDKIYIETVFDEINEIEDQEDRIVYLLDLAKQLSSTPESLYTENDRVKGCASKTYIKLTKNEDLYHIDGTSDSQFAKSFIFILAQTINGKSKDEILRTLPLIKELLKNKTHLLNLTPSRSNSFYSALHHLEVLVTSID